MRWIYLVFGFFAILIGYHLAAIFDAGDLLRRLGRLLSHSLEFAFVGKFQTRQMAARIYMAAANRSQSRKITPIIIFCFTFCRFRFCGFSNAVMAAKVAAVTYSTLAIFSVYWLMFRYKIDYLLLWFFALFGCASSFLFRMNMAKAPPLTIIFTVAGIYLLFERKYVWLLPLMFAFVWTYSLFPLLFIGGDHLDDHHRLERKKIRMATACLYVCRDGSGKCHQSVFSGKSRTFLRAFLDEI